jgi:hypothetical protein
LSLGLKLRIQPDQQRLEPSDNPAGFTNERLALPARPLGVLLGKRRHQDHLAMAAFAAQPAEKATLQKLRVEPIGLRPAVFARHSDTRCMNDVDLDAECGEWDRRCYPEGTNRLLLSRLLAQCDCVHDAPLHDCNTIHCMDGRQS